MKRFVLTTVLALSLTVLITGCGNRSVFDTKWTYKQAKIFLGDEVIEVDVKSWRDYDDTSIQIIAKDGQVYLTDLKNVVLIGD